MTKVDLREWRNLVGQHKSEIAGRILLFDVGDEILRALIEVQELSGKFRRESRRGRLRGPLQEKKDGERSRLRQVFVILIVPSLCSMVTKTGPSQS